MKFVKNPNLPKNVSAVLVAKDTPGKVLEGLYNLKIKVFFGSEIPFAVNAVRCHVDTQIFHAGGKKFVVHPLLAEYYKKLLPDAEIISGEKSGIGNYPDDAAYNVARVAGKAIHNFDFADKNVLREISGERIKVKQGYSKCSLCIVDENSVITEDKGIADTLERHNMEVLKISAGDVCLTGLSHGFLGGGTGKLGRNILAFAGDIKSHRDYKEIYEFCTKRNVKPISLCEGKITDIGSIIPLAEKE